MLAKPLFVSLLLCAAAAGQSLTAGQYPNLNPFGQADMIVHAGAIPDEGDGVNKYSYVAMVSPGIVAFVYDGPDERIEYRVDLDESICRGQGGLACSNGMPNCYNPRNGLVRIHEVESGAIPVDRGGICYKDSCGVARVSQWMEDNGQTTITQLQLTGDSLIIDYDDDVSCAQTGCGNEGTHRRRHTYTILGKSLRLRIQDLRKNLDVNSNFCGTILGDSAGMNNIQQVEMVGTLAAPIYSFQDASNEQFFFGMVLDQFNSNASNWSLNAANYGQTWTTKNQYDADDTGQLSAPLDDTYSIIVTRFVTDAAVTTSRQASPYLNLLKGRAGVLLSGGVCPPQTACQGGTGQQGWFDGLISYEKHFQDLDDWGVEIAAYPFKFWSSHSYDGSYNLINPDPPAINNAGPEWYPAQDHAGMVAFGAAAAARGQLLGAYTSFNLMPNTAPATVVDCDGNAATIFDIQDAAHDQNNNPKLSVNPPGIPLMSPTRTGKHAKREYRCLKDDYDFGLVYLDISTYGSLSKGVDGEHLDQVAGSNRAKTLADGYREQKAWIEWAKGYTEGPLMGEGSVASGPSNQEWLWAGYCDSVQSAINTDGGAEAHKLCGSPSSPNPLAPTEFPVIPNFSVEVLSRLQANHGNGIYDRLFGPSDGPPFVTGTSCTPPSCTVPNQCGSPDSVVFPLAEEAMDRSRIYEITYAKIAYFETRGPIADSGNTVKQADMIKEYYMMRALQERYLSSPSSAILYEFGGSMQSFEDIYAVTQTTDSFRHPRIQMLYENGLVVFLNHGTTDWDLTPFGLAYDVPEDGFYAEDASGFVSFSAIPHSIAPNRIDYCNAPGEYECMDGRGVIGAWGNLDASPENRLLVDNLPLHKTIQEQAVDGSIVATAKAGAAPTLLRVEVRPATASLGITEQLGFEAVEVYSGGIFRDVTKRVGWSTTNKRATVNQAGVAEGRVVGSSQISVNAGATPVVNAKLTVLPGQM